MWESDILALGDGSVLVQCGPMRMFIEASEAGRPRQEICLDAARAAVGYLKEIADERFSLMRPAVETPPLAPGSLPYVMWDAARSVGDADLTPMAAVAGTIADATADFLADRGMTRVAVNNGGDIAVRLEHGETLRVGIRRDVQMRETAQIMIIRPEMGIGGVCTSGLGGWSFTRGIANAVTALAPRAAIADAAATAVANRTNVESPVIERCLAEHIHPDTDLKGVPITRSVGRLTPTEIEEALDRGVEAAENLSERGLIHGALLFVRRHTGATSAFVGDLDGRAGAVG